MLVRWLTTILPMMTVREAFEATYIHRVTGGTWYPPYGKWASRRS